jgi:hypothetical protein
MVAFHSYRNFPYRLWAMVDQLKPRIPSHCRDMALKCRLQRVFISLPLLGLFVLAAVIMNPIPAIASARKMVDSGRVSWETGSIAVVNKFYYVKPLDDL